MSHPFPRRRHSTESPLGISPAQFTQPALSLLLVPDAQAPIQNSSQPPSCSLRPPPSSRAPIHEQSKPHQPAAAPPCLILCSRRPSSSPGVRRNEQELVHGASLCFLSLPKTNASIPRPRATPSLLTPATQPPGPCPVDPAAEPGRDAPALHLLLCFVLSSR